MEAGIRSGGWRSQSTRPAGDSAHMAGFRLRVAYRTRLSEAEEGGAKVGSHKRRCLFRHSVTQEARSSPYETAQEKAKPRAQRLEDA
jgi:hypothetical protein